MSIWQTTTKTSDTECDFYGTGYCKPSGVALWQIDSDFPESGYRCWYFCEYHKDYAFMTWEGMRISNVPNVISFHRI
jgi:hypothetical protein